MNNVEVLRKHAAICNGAIEVRVAGPALKEHAKIFSGAADEIERLRGMVVQCHTEISQLDDEGPCECELCDQGDSDE